MKEFDEKTLDEVLATNDQDEIKKYYEYIESMKSSNLTRDIVESLYGEPLSVIWQEILEEEQKYTSMMMFPGDVVMFYPNIKEQKARSFITCDFSAGIIYPGSMYVNYRPLIANISSGERYVLSRTIKVEMGYQHELPRTIQEFEALDNRLKIESYSDNSGIEYSHFSQRMGGELVLQKLKRRRKK